MSQNDRFKPFEFNKKKRKKIKLYDNVNQVKTSLSKLNEEIEVLLSEPNSLKATFEESINSEMLDLLLIYFKEITNGFDVTLTFDEEENLTTFTLSKDVGNISEQAKSVITAIINRFNNTSSI